MFQNENIVKYILKILSRRARFEKCFILVWNNLECTNLCTSCMKKIQNFPKSMEEHCQRYYIQDKKSRMFHNSV